MLVSDANTHTLKLHREERSFCLRFPPANLVCCCLSKASLDLRHAGLSHPRTRVRFVRSQLLQIRKIIFDLSYMQHPPHTPTTPFSCTYIPHGPLFSFHNLSFQLLFLLHLISLLSSPPTPPPPLSSASSSFCLLCWQKKKGPSRFLQRPGMAFISRYIAPSSSSAPLRRQRASKVLRYCHLQFLFYLRFFNSVTPRGAVHNHVGLHRLFATLLIAFFTYKTFLLIFTLFYVNAALKLQSYLSTTRDHRRRRFHPLDPLD